MLSKRITWTESVEVTLVYPVGPRSSWRVRTPDSGGAQPVTAFVAARV